MPIRTCRATLADLDRLVPLFDGYRQFYGQPSQPVVCRDFLRARLERGESVVFLALDDADADPVRGFTQLYPAFSSVQARRIWWLNDLFVLPEARGRGAGRALLDAAGAHAQASGAARLMLETGADNAYAQGLYERYGYTRLDPGSRFYQLVLAP
jgi:ribosomal protein S18 acetylase RimI-like enzyme